MRTFEKGNISEAKLLSKFLELGYRVAIPFGEGSKYDLVIENKEGELKKVQIKTATFNDDCIKLNVCSNNKGYSKQSYKGLVDYIAAYCPDNGACYLIPIEDCPTVAMTLRVKPSKNNQKSKINLASDYLMK